MAPPAKVSVTHEALMDWMIMNPGGSMKELAATFGYSQSWLSSIIHSGCFKSRLAEKRGEITAMVAMDLPAKLAAAAGASLDILNKHLETSTDPDFALSVAEMSLKGLGYGAKTGGVVINQGNANIQQVFASPADLAEARLLITQQNALPPAPAATLELQLCDTQGE